MSGESSNTNVFLVNRTKISLLTFAIMAALAVLARVSAYFYSVTATDIVYMTTFIPTVFYYASSLFDVAMMFIGYALVSYYIIAGGLRHSVLPIIYAALSILLSYVMIVVFNMIERSSADILSTLVYLLANYAAEIFRLAVIAAIAVIVKKLRGAAQNGDLKIHGFAPFSNQFNFVAFLSAVIVVVGKALVELFNYTLPFFETYSDVTAQEISGIITTYLLIIVTGALGYFLSHLTTTLIARVAGVPADAHNDI